MSSDRVVDVSYKKENVQTAGSKFGGGLAGLVGGPVVIVLACLLLWSNEGWAIKTHRSLNEAFDKVVYLNHAQHFPQTHNEGKLVHIQDQIHVTQRPRDNIFHFERNSVLIKRHVKIYQWVETHKTVETKIGDGQVKVEDVYEYNLEWVDVPINSNKFRNRESHQNSGDLPFRAETVHASGVKLGSFALHEALRSQLAKETMISLYGLDLRLSRGMEIVGNTVYLTNNYTSRNTAVAVGDVEVSFTEVECGVVSVVAKQQGNELVPWASSEGAGYDVGILTTGTVSASDMISGAQTSNTIWTWILRIIGLLMNAIGFSILTSLIGVLADLTFNWIPFVGPMAVSIIDLGLSIANLIFALTLSFFVAALAWIFYRPIFGISMLIGAIWYLQT